MTKELPRIMRTIKIYAVPCDINVWLDYKQAKALATEYIEYRLSRPIIIWPGWCTSKLQIGSPAPVSRDKETLESGQPYIKVKVNGNKCRIYAMYGTSLDDVDESIIKFARKMWLDKVFIERDDDGEM